MCFATCCTFCTLLVICVYFLSLFCVAPTFSFRKTGGFFLCRRGSFNAWFLKVCEKEAFTEVLIFFYFIGLEPVFLRSSVYVSYGGLLQKIVGVLRVTVQRAEWSFGRGGPRLWSTMIIQNRILSRNHLYLFEISRIFPYNNHPQ